MAYMLPLIPLRFRFHHEEQSVHPIRIQLRVSRTPGETFVYIGGVMNSMSRLDDEFAAR